MVTLNLPNSETCMAEEKIIRGDMEFMKVDAGDRSAMAGIPFDLISKTTGERHRILTDENGYYSTAAAYAPHTRNTNAGTSPSDGIWFGAGEPDNKLGALPYDTYILEEKPCAANAGKDLAVLEFTVSRNNFTVNLGSICNYTVELHTEAKDTATGTKTVAPSAEASVTDTVTYRNLTVGRQYRITGQLILKETGEPLVSDGVPVVAETEFVPESRDGTVEVVFHFDASDLKGQALVAYEYLTWNGIPVASHEDPDDTDQTVYIPEISTTAYDRDTGSRTGRVQKDALIEDTIEYRGLTPGKSYRLSGVLMDRDAGEPLLVNGKEVRASRSFVPDAPDGTVCMLFRFDASGLAGRTIVAFESISYENTEVAVHADLEDENQSVHYPELRTKALDGNTGTHMGILSANASIKDTVFYENLIPGQEYVIRGSLVRKGTGEALTADGNPVMSEQAFTAGQPSGAVTLTYELDSRELAGQTAVVYEELFCGGMAVSGHKDPEDENQSIHYPAVEQWLWTAEPEAMQGPRRKRR